MINNKIAVQFVKWKLQVIEWFPGRIDRLEDDEIVGWPVLPFGWIVGKFLREEIQPDDIEHKWRGHGVALLNAHAETYQDEDQFIEAMVYLIASQPDTLAKVSEWMVDHGYKAGNFDFTP